LASSSATNPWGISDHDRHTREIQGVVSSLLFAEDHTHQVTRNYYNKKKLEANALWDCATETGEIASAVLVPIAIYSNRWPVNVEFWSLLFGKELIGRLGLFHFLQRIIRTMRKSHIDYLLAISMLLDAVYFYNQEDYNNLLRVL
jgi:hypothetical protein